ncbi:MAG TPA: UDP-N-acetylglucosamine 1-carboxyvinyltransferase [Planctomycetes bacterium]|nr:UDP-N-acetylglucosamine 1-carboxyvinyltransferase [Fuerstiella sp.]HIK91828.1 UDP-N-acetylglucosamine 1-carboxyvinyltransferase [Planctomycetota bacterium]
MDMLVVQGGCTLRGDVYVDGAKNAALPIMAASILLAGDVRIKRVPDLVDVQTMSLLLQSLGAKVTRSEGSLDIDTRDVASQHADYELVRRMRASVCVLGPLIARFGRASVSLPGGCNIGHRPIDLHLKGLAALGADLRIERGYVIAEASQLRGADVFLGGPGGSTVTGTCNVMTAACLAKGRTIIRAAASEPEVADLGRFLNDAGARISGLGTSTVEITGVEGLTSVTHTVIPDRIEAATFAIAAAATRGEISIHDVRPGQMTSVIEALRAIGVAIHVTDDRIDISASGPLRSVELAALPFPGIPTDTQAQFMALLATVAGISVVTDRVFPDRFMHASELVRMGAAVRREGASVVIDGGGRLTGTSVMASDLRASAALVIAALAADGESQIRRIYHLDRGYARLEQKLNGLGADVFRRPDVATSTKRPHYLQEDSIGNKESEVHLD